MADLITPDELVAALPDLDGSSDLDALIGAASAAIEGYCGRPLDAGTESETFSFDFMAESLWLRRTPVLSIGSVAIDGIELDPADYKLLNAKTGEIARVSGRHRRLWPPGIGRVEVQYTGGYSPIPADLKRCCILQVSDLVDAPGRIQSEKLGDYQYTLANGDPSGISPNVARMLGRYRLMRLTSGG
ncbi:MAG: hypothetical protein U0790_00130 [Isosphaeraceae bacterium]